ncbi:MAG: thioredoxin domain-containing protein [Candidatus Binatia bacterium]
MIGDRVIRMLAGCALVGGLLAGCGGGPQTPSGGTAAGGGAPNEEQIVRYYRKKNNVPPNVKIAIANVKDATGIGGAKEATLQVGEGPSAKNTPVLLSGDGHFVAFAAAEDVTQDPAKALMAKIKLQGEPARGPAAAKVTIVEWSDFQCPFCSRGYNTLEQQVLKEYGDKVKFYFKHYPLPFHPWAEPAAVAAECAKQQSPDAFWKVYHGFFANQKDINQQNVKDKATEYLKDSGIDMAKWGECVDGKKTTDLVKAQMQEGSGLGVTGTPSFFINGRQLVGAQPFENFKAVIDDELAAK